MPIARRPLLTLLLAWLAAGGFFVFAASWPPVSRTQEGRVLETAREMAGRPVADWAIPRLNGAVRLRKPPLAYWLSAASFRVFGVGDLAGRLPMTLLAWLTLGTTFLIGRRLFDARTAVFAAATLAGSWLFMKSALLAETDGPTAAFLALGVYAALRAADAPPRRDIVWQHALAACAALAILCKGPPAVYLVLFVVGRCAVRRQWRPAWRFVTTGAIATLLVLAVPWFVYVMRYSTDEGQLGADLLNSAEGGDHHGPPWYYVPLLLQATLPWTAVWAAALWTAGGALWRGRPARGSGSQDTGGTPVPRRFGQWSSIVTLGVWGLSVLLPLCVWGNKQLQYLVPAMVPTMILVGWALAGVTRRRPWATAAMVAVGVTAAALALVGGAALIAFLVVRANVIDGRVVLTFGDATVAMAVFGLAVWSVSRWRRGGMPGVLATAVLAAGVMFVPLAWLPTVVGDRGRNAAAAVMARYPAGRFVFRGSELPVMSWAMRRAVPMLSEPAIAAAAADPATVVLEQQQNDEHKPTPPAGFVTDYTIKQRENVLHVFVPKSASKAFANLP